MHFTQKMSSVIKVSCTSSLRELDIESTIV